MQCDMRRNHNVCFLSAERSNRRGDMKPTFFLLSNFSPHFTLHSLLPLMFFIFLSPAPSFFPPSPSLSPLIAQTFAHKIASHFSVLVILNATVWMPCARTRAWRRGLEEMNGPLTCVMTWLYTTRPRLPDNSGAARCQASACVSPHPLNGSFREHREIKATQSTQGRRKKKISRPVSGDTVSC